MFQSFNHPTVNTNEESYIQSAIFIHAAIFGILTIPSPIQDDLTF